MKLHPDFNKVFLAAFSNGNDTVHVDGTNSARGIEILAQSEEAGLTTCIDSGSDTQQYTCFNYTITKDGLSFIEDIKELNTRAI